jgi:hypothetical protein
MATQDIMVSAIDVTIRGGKYQPLAPYEIREATASDPILVPASAVNRDARSAIVAQLKAAGFIRSTGNYVSVRHLAQARICVQGAGPQATIGVEIFDEPHAAELLGVREVSS